MDKKNIILLLTIVLMGGCSPLRQSTHSSTELRVQKPKSNVVMLYPEAFSGERTDSLKPRFVVEPEISDVRVSRAYPTIVFTAAQSANVKYSDKTLSKFGVKLDLNELSKEFTYPYSSVVTSEYGVRGSGIHTGIDLKAISCDTIRAIFDGVVRVSKRYSSYGNIVVIRHYNGLETVYAHNRKNLVKVNNVVRSGDPISLEGNTGRSTTSHLHFEVRVDGEYFNPRKLIDFNNKKLQSGTLTISKSENKPLLAILSSVDVKENIPTDMPTFKDSKPTPDLKVKKYHKIVSGDTLYGIALRNKMSVASLCKLNNITRDSVIKIGKTLRVR